MAITPSPSDRTLTKLLGSSHKIEMYNSSIASDTSSIEKNIQRIADSLAGGSTTSSGVKSSTSKSQTSSTTKRGKGSGFIDSILSSVEGIKDPKTTVERAAALKEVIGSIDGISKSTFDAISNVKKVSWRQARTLKKFILTITGIFGQIERPTTVLRGAEAVKTISEGLVGITKNLFKAVGIMRGINIFASKKQGGGFDRLIESLGDTFRTAGGRKKSIETGVKVVGGMADAILQLSKNTMKAVLMMGPVLPLIGLLGKGIQKLATTFAKIGDDDKLITRGVQSISGMGKAMIMMAGGILAIGGAIALIVAVNPILLLGIPMMVLGLAGAFALAGKAPVKSGAISMGIAGLSMIALSAGMFALGMVVQKVGAVEILKGLGLIAVTGLVFGVAGIGPVPAAIALGAIALGLAGLSLMALGKGLGMFMDAVGDITVEKSEAAIGALVGMGVAFAGIGLAAPFIIPGSAAALLMGGSMLSVAAGVEAVKNADYFKGFDVDKFTEVIVGIGGAFAAIGQEGGAGAGGVLGWLTGIELGPNNVERGIKSVLKANEAMTSIANGLVNFKTLTEGLNFGISSDGTVQPGGLISSIGLVIGSVGKVFADVGALDKTSNRSLIGAIFGADFEEGDVQNGIDVTKKSGKALMSLAEGLKSFNKFVVNELGGFGQGGQGKLDSISQGIASVIGTVGSAFSSLGKADDRSWFDWSNNDAEEGVKIAQKYGGVLESLATGLGAFANMGNIPTITGYTSGPNGEQVPIYGPPVKITDIGNNLKNFIGLTADVLIEMSGKMDEANGSFRVSKVWHNFTEDLLALSKAADPFNKFADGFVKMAGGMSTFSRSFNDMGSPQAMIAFTNWTEQLIKISEAGGDDSFLSGVKAFFGIQAAGAEGAINAGAAADDAMSTSSEREEIYNAANEASGDKAMATQTAAILGGLRDLSTNIASLRNALMSQGIDVNVVGIDGNVSIRTIEQP